MSPPMLDLPPRIIVPERPAIVRPAEFEIAKPGIIRLHKTVNGYIFFPPMLLVGLGMAITVAPLTTVVMTAVGSDEVGVASGVNNTVARVAGLLAVAVVGLLAMAVFGRSLGRRAEPLPLAPAVRAALAAERRMLGDIRLPAGATAEERRTVGLAVAESLVASFRWTSASQREPGGASLARMPATASGDTRVSTVGTSHSSVNCIQPPGRSVEWGRRKLTGRPAGGQARVCPTIRDERQW